MKRFAMSLRLFLLRFDISALWLIAAFVVRLIYVFGFTDYQHYLYTDMGAYDERASLLASGQYVNFSTYWAPFYHLFLAPIYYVLKLLGLYEQRVAVVVIISALGQVVAIWAIYKIVQKLYTKKLANFILPLLVFLYPWIYLNIFVLSENLFIPIFWLSLYFLISRTHNYKNLAIFGVLWGLAVIARPILLPSSLIVLVWLAIAKVGWRKIGLTLCGTLVILVAMSLFNIWYTHGETTFITSGGGFNSALVWCNLKSIEYNTSNARYGFAPPANGSYPEYTRKFTEVPFEQQNYYYDLASKCVIEHPEYLFINLRNVANLFVSVVFPSADSIVGWEPLMSIFRVLAIVLVYFAAISSVVRMNKFKFLWLGLLAALFGAVYLQNPGEERYLWPMWPLLILLNLDLGIVINRWIARRRLVSKVRSALGKFSLAG